MNNIQQYTLSVLQVENLQTVSTLPSLLPAHKIEVFSLHLPDIHDELSMLFSLLSFDEQERARRFHFAKDANLFIAAHGLLRIILAHYLHLSPQEVSFITRPGGKPILPSYSSPLSFNISHSGEMVAVGLSSTAEIGIDIETIRPFENFMEIAANYFHPQEALAISTLPQERQLHKFYRIWTQKEAVVKALGTGLTTSLKQFSVLENGNLWGEVIVNDYQKKQRIYSRNLCSDKGYCGSVSIIV